VAEWARSKGLGLEEVLYMGDDHIDLPVFEVVGLSVAPANADPHVRARAAHVTAARGGEGAVREAVVWLLEGAGRLEEALAAYRERVSGDTRESAE
jgi:3-deoxy-D-manno-octulosonate 8-phosphate phosphatase (KDO 8-P phosphatase)